MTIEYPDIDVVAKGLRDELRALAAGAMGSGCVEAAEPTVVKTSRPMVGAGARSEE